MRREARAETQPLFAYKCAPGTKELAQAVSNDVIGSPLLWNMLGTSSACGDFQSFAAAAQSKMDSASATGFSGAMRRFSTHIGSAARAGLAEVMQAQDVQEVSSAAREGYMSQLGALSEESMSATETYIDDLSKGLGALAAFRFYFVVVLHTMPPLPPRACAIAVDDDCASRLTAGPGVNRSKTQRKMEAMEMYGSVYGSAHQRSDD